MKKIFAILAALCLGAAAFAQQTPEEIFARMDEVMNAREADGMIMTVDIKIPILGTMSSRSWMLGNKTKVVSSTMGVDVVNWMDTDAAASWTYDSKDNKIKITSIDANKTADESSDADMFSGVTDGYDVTLKKETDTAWYFVATKQKTNTNKDDPKTMDVVIAKETYYPVSLSAKVKGITMTMKDIDFGVSEADVTFDPSQYPDAIVEDQR